MCKKWNIYIPSDLRINNPTKLLATESSKSRSENSSGGLCETCRVLERLQSSVLDPVLVNVEIVEDLRAAGGGARQQVFLSFSHQPLPAVCRHVTGHVILGPGVQPGLEASVEASVDPLVGLMSPCERCVSVHVVL